MVSAYQSSKSEQSSSINAFVGLPITLQLLTQSGDQFELPGYDRITVGRKMRENHTTLDLERYDGGALGISRRHLEILPLDGKLTIQDLYSVMGTWLNSEQLQAGARYPITHGDVIQMGKLSVTVYFSRNVVQSA